MPKHAEDGPISERDAKANADAILADPHSHGHPAAHAASQRLERLDDPAHQHPSPGPGPEWTETPEGWVHDTEG